jgi:hypothetical protein
MSEKKMMAEGAWVVVADGHGARVLVKAEATTAGNNATMS